MNNILKVLENNKHIFIPFSEVYVFGSVLTTNKPNDIDILLVYQPKIILISNIKELKNNLIKTISNYTCLDIDFTTLSIQELKKSSFLTKLPLYVKIL